MKKLIVVLVAVVLLVGGCRKTYTWDENRPTFHHTSGSEVDTPLTDWQLTNWQRDWAKNQQDMNDCLAEHDSIIGQEAALLKTLGNDEQIQSADFQLYKDFLLYIQKSDDQIKTYEFIEKMRAALPADKMETIETLYRQLKQNEAKYSSLRNRQVALIERIRELRREADIAAYEAMHR